MYCSSRPFLANSRISEIDKHRKLNSEKLRSLVGGLILQGLGEACHLQKGPSEPLAAPVLRDVLALIVKMQPPTRIASSAAGELVIFLSFSETVAKDPKWPIHTTAPRGGARKAQQLKHEAGGREQLVLPDMETTTTASPAREKTNIRFREALAGAAAVRAGDSLEKEVNSLAQTRVRPLQGHGFNSFCLG